MHAFSQSHLCFILNESYLSALSFLELHPHLINADLRWTALLFCSCFTWYFTFSMNMKISGGQHVKITSIRHTYFILLYPSITNFFLLTLTLCLLKSTYPGFFICDTAVKIHYKLCYLTLDLLSVENSYMCLLSGVSQLHDLATKKRSRFQKWLTYIMRGVSLVMIPVGAVVPSVSIFSLALSWLKSSSELSNLIYRTSYF